MRSLVFALALCLAAFSASASADVTIGVMPKLTGIDYFNAVERGALAAGKELGVTVVYDGPVTNDTARQSAMVETWIARKFDAICIAPNDPHAIAPVLRKAMKRGIKVVTYDADAKPDARDWFVNMVTYEAIAKALIEGMARNAGPEARYVILTGSLTAANQNIWMEKMEAYRRQHYPNMANLSPTPKATQEDQALATQVAIDVLKSYPNLQGLFAITSVALPGAAEALAREKAFDRIFLTGLSTPNSMRTYVEQGVCREVVLWNPEDLGYLAVQVAAAAAKGTLTPGATTFNAGKLGEKKIDGKVLVLGDPLVFTKENIGQYQF